MSHIIVGAIDNITYLRLYYELAVGKVKERFVFTADKIKDLRRLTPAPAPAPAPAPEPAPEPEPASDLAPTAE